MWTFGIIFIAHALILLSVFDINFKTNVYTGLKSIENNITTPSKRLVLFVSDGLPAEYLYEFTGKETYTPFIRSLMENNGTWGLSYSRVPTESRPGHIALIAGLYEDPSAVFKGWKENPVLFDSVFNRTNATFMWGCHDILHLFQKGSNQGNIYSYSYPSEMQDYSGKNGSASLLDNWVLEKFIEFNDHLKSNKTLNDTVHGSGVVFFFHLLGVDLAGHVNKPKSGEYNITIRNVDRVVKALVERIDLLFNDNQTTYILTADHGMTDWGSHGAGTPIETNTPIVAWGAGIKKPLKLSSTQSISYTNKRLNNEVKPTPDQWKLSHLLRNDMNQADIAVLMSVVLGIPIPVNSVGVLPLNILDFPIELVAKAYLLNAKQLMEQFYATEEDLKSQLTSILFSCENDMCYDSLSDLLGDIEQAIANHKHMNAIELTDNIISLIMSGIDYFNFFFRNILHAHVLYGFVSIILIITGQILKNWDPEDLIQYGVDTYANTSAQTVLIVKFSIAATVIMILFLGSGLLPGHYGFYVITSLFFTIWSFAANPWIFSVPKMLLKKEMISTVLVYTVGIALLICCFFERWVISLGLIAFSFWPLQNKTLRSVVPCRSKFAWFGSCLVLSVFPLLPIVENQEDIYLKLTVGTFWFTVLCFFQLSTPYSIPGANNAATKIQLIITPLILYNMNDITEKYSRGEGLQLFNQFSSFAYLFILLGTMKYGSKRLRARFLNIGYSVGLSFLMFSLSYEAAFPLVLNHNLITWMHFEELLEHEPKDPIFDYDSQPEYVRQDDFRKSFFYLFYIFVSFFGIGNLASFNSFNINWTRQFVGTFSPFSIMALIILRTVLPLFLVTCAFRFIIQKTNADVKVLFQIVLIFCDAMAAYFLFRVQNIGSWMDIGTSLSRFVIMECIVLFLFLLYCLAEIVYSSCQES